MELSEESLEIDTDITGLLQEIEQLQKEMHTITFMKDFMLVWTIVFTFIICKCSYILYVQKSTSTLRMALYLLRIPYIVAILKQLHVPF